MVHTFLLPLLVIMGTISYSKGEVLDDVEGSSSNQPNGCNSVDFNETFHFRKPKNHICSISYLLYTEYNRNLPCYLEPENHKFNRCKFDLLRKTKILIHGYLVQLLPGNVFELIKNSLLSEDNYNVIIVNWTRYNHMPYFIAFSNAYFVGKEVGKFINFLTHERGVDPADVHLIGHSLGAHIAGVAGKVVSNLGRISGLDPAAPLYFKIFNFNRLTDSDADFVDVIHCSNGAIDLRKGLGIPYPIGDVDFYPNGGEYQPSCEFGEYYLDPDGEKLKVDSDGNLPFCRHDICVYYYLYSIRDCEFLGRECSRYERYNSRKCISNSHPTNMMGFHAQKFPGLPNNSKFYLNTTTNPPYCLKDCD